MTNSPLAEFRALAAPGTGDLLSLGIEMVQNGGVPFAAGLRYSIRGSSRVQAHARKQRLSPWSESHMPTSREDRRGLILLVSLLILLLVSPFAAEGRTGESIFVLALYGAIAAATIELSQERSLRLPSLTLALCSFSITVAAIYHPVRMLWIATWTLMALFFGYVSVILFVHLGRPGRITRGRLYVSVSLYLLLQLECSTSPSP